MLYINDIDSSPRLLDKYSITDKFRPRFAGEESSQVNPNATIQLHQWLQN